MKLAVMQPYLFPYLGYFQLVRAVDQFVVFDDVAFIKGGWINRNRILINGEPSLFTIPVQRETVSSSIQQVLIDNKTVGRWSAKLLKTIDNTYRRAPQFKAVFPLVERVLDPNVLGVGELAFRSIKAVTEFLNLTTTFIDSSVVYRNAHLAGETRIIDICRIDGASDYVNAPGGRHLYTASRFAELEIQLHFLVPTLPNYTQFGKEFVAGLSIIDVLMFNHRDVVRTFLDQYTLT